ncbi:MAG: TrkH family potassium uptake protein [Deltaproteobacteria bacterium]|nr:MAG: TrkH family potassium uptake protein [Deltaproteobacteria bacterium]
MRFRQILRVIGILNAFLGLFMLAPLIVSLVYSDGSFLPILYSFFITSASGLLLFLIARTADYTALSQREGMAIVTFSWLSAGLFGSLPFLFSGSIGSLTDAFFESLSGFTTTGASVLNNIESLPQGVLFWRGLTQWLGGMGIIVFSIAILPFLGVGGMQLYKAEIPSPVVDKLQPRISETAKTLWKVYLLITVIEIGLLFAGGMSLFDSICHTFCTMPTGGFSTHGSSIAYFNSAYFEGVITVFMALAGVNFALHFRFLKGDFRVFSRDPECRIFLLILAALILLVTANIYGTVYDSVAGAFRRAAFQVTSIITTTGFVTSDYETWPALSQIILFLCMFIGAMAGSTGGAIKIMRIVLLVKYGFREIFRLVHPHAVRSVKLGRKPVPEEVLNSIGGFFILYLGLYVAAVLIMSFLGLDVITSLGSVAATIGNVGPGFGLVGPVRNYLTIPDPGKWGLTFCMLVGRLEIYTVIVMLAPAYWRK